MEIRRYLVRFSFLGCKRKTWSHKLQSWPTSFSFCDQQRDQDVEWERHLSSLPRKTSHYHWRRRYPLGRSPTCCWCCYQWLFWKRRVKKMWHTRTMTQHCSLQIAAGYKTNVFWPQTFFSKSVFFMFWTTYFESPLYVMLEYVTMCPQSMNTVYQHSYPRLSCTQWEEEF